MSDIITRVELEEAKTDAKDLGECVNGNETGIVTPRYGNPYPTLPMLSRLFEAMIAAGYLRIDDLQSAIDIALAAGAGAAGWTASLVLDKSGKTQQYLNDNLSFHFDPLSLSINRVLYDKIIEQASIKDFGAIGDGTLHTLQEWVDSGEFANLAEIQAKFPFVKSLTQSIDWCATQHAVLNAQNVYAPKGTYVLSDVVKLPQNTTPYNVGSAGTGIKLYGDGVKTCFKRNDIRPATRILTVDGASTTQESDEANLTEACFSVHAPYTNIKNMTIADSAIGIYLGQDYARPFTSLSAVHKSNFEGLAIDRCGTGILMLATGGNHYCNFSDIHFSCCQIDVDLRSSYWWKVVQGRGDSNNNRNVFTRLRSARSRVGFWNSCGDSNNLICWHAESMPNSANTFPMPDWLPPDLTVSTALIFSGSNQLNTVSQCFAEDVAHHVYNDGYENRFFGNGFTEDKVIMKQSAKEWRSRYVMRDRGIGYADNVFAAFPEIPVAGALYLGLGISASIPAPNGVRVVSRDFWHQPKSSDRGSFEREFQIETGAIAASTPVAFTIWGNFDASASGMVELDIVGRCDVTGQTSTYMLKALANVYKASTRVPSRYSIHKIFASRSTGQGISDTTDAAQIIASLQINPSVGQELQVVLTCPLALTSATIFVKQRVAK
ncbi:hypothetical protein ACTZ9G_003267 [Acinetobacter baumannii]|nr:hypothetical protein [Acinetobacter baumannii]EKT9383025.1 hypothetical protein [Acinetobacter baumannii]EKT9862265.1 hypothetical protein [Acinetobacter baumannii]EKT9906929.1 hypothetical protein [Acinetobacter baumannii]EKT9921668.1 hypothetical protein [Acinetobacter baumannii]